MSAENEPLLRDLNVLAHELEHDCNYPFAQLKDVNGELYSTKLERLRDRLSDIDAMLDEHRKTVAKLASSEAEWNRKEAVLVAAAQEIERKLSSAEAKLADAIADAASWQKQADERLNDAVEFGRRAEKAEARVDELEGLAIGNESAGDGGRWFEVFIPTERLGGANCEGEECPTIGHAMPRKEGV